MPGFFLFRHLNLEFGCQFGWGNPPGLLSRSRAGKGPTQGVLALHRNQGAFASAVELHKFGEARPHLLTGAIDLGFVTLAILLEGAPIISALSKEQIVEAPGSLQRHDDDARLGLGGGCHHEPIVHAWIASSGCGGS